MMHLEWLAEQRRNRDRRERNATVSKLCRVYQTLALVCGVRRIAKRRWSSSVSCPIRDIERISGELISTAALSTQTQRKSYTTYIPYGLWESRTAN